MRLSSVEKGNMITIRIVGPDHEGWFRAKDKDDNTLAYGRSFDSTVNLLWKELHDDLRKTFREHGFISVRLIDEQPA